MIAGYAFIQNLRRGHYVLDPRQLTSTLHRLVVGGTVIEPDLVSMLLEQRRERGPLDRLTQREREVLRLMAEGLSDRGIAERLCLSLNTISTHIQHVFGKLELPDGATHNRRVHAVLTYLQNPQQPSRDDE